MKRAKQHVIKVQIMCARVCSRGTYQEGLMSEGPKALESYKARAALHDRPRAEIGSSRRLGTCRRRISEMRRAFTRATTKARPAIGRVSSRSATHYLYCNKGRHGQTESGMVQRPLRRRCVYCWEVS